MQLGSWLAEKPKIILVMVKMELEIKPCKTKATFSVKPKRQITIDLPKLKNKFKIKIETPIASVIEFEGEEVIVHRHGELKFKTLKDEDKIRKIAEMIYLEFAKKGLVFR